MTVIAQDDHLTAGAWAACDLDRSQSVDKDDTRMSKASKSRGKTHGKNGKTGKCAEEQDNESTNSFQNYDSRRLLMFLYQGCTCIQKRKPRF